MVFLPPIEIIVLLSGEAPSPSLLGRRICLQALPNGRFAIAVQDSPPWQADLAASQAEKLAALIDRLPEAAPPQGPGSFDGQQYSLEVISNTARRTFGWANDDWRYAPETARAEWQAIAALANYVLELAAEMNP